jgi:hypothetical protein
MREARKQWRTKNTVILATGTLEQWGIFNEP